MEGLNSKNKSIKGGGSRWQLSWDKTSICKKKFFHDFRDEIILLVVFYERKSIIFYHNNVKLSENNNKNILL